MIDKNLVDRHIPTLLKNANSKMQRLKLRINEFEKLKAEEVSKREQHQNNISDKDYEMKSINLDLENSVDQYKNLIKLNNIIQQEFSKSSKKITKNTREKINEILKKKNAKKIK